MCCRAVGNNGAYFALKISDYIILRLMSLYSVFGAVAEAIPSIDKCHI
jgi:hypothetical protein